MTKTDTWKLTCWDCLLTINNRGIICTSICFTGGQERVCLLGDEICTSKGVMRATGDWAVIKNSQVYYLGRKDRLIKRHGQQVDLNALQQVRVRRNHLY